MDNITHSLVGAVMGQAGLKRKTGLAMPALIIGANIPDIDASCTVFGMVSLAMRRGVTHGPIAMLLLPIALTGILLAYDRWQMRRGTWPADRLPVRPLWLLALAFIGCLSHPFFDWLNSYGIRLLEPFSSRWFYGDALFIVDPWLLAALIAGVWISRRWEKRRAKPWRWPAITAFIAMSAYLATNIGMTSAVAAREQVQFPHDIAVVANPVPLKFWEREILWRGGGNYGVYHASWFEDGVAGAPRSHIAIPIGMDDPRIAERVAHSPEARAFLFWSRMPVARLDGQDIILTDQRFLDTSGGRFEVRLKP